VELHGDGEPYPFSHKTRQRRIFIENHAVDEVQFCEEVEQNAQHRRAFTGRTFFSRIIRDKRDFAVASGYIGGNPVKAKLVKDVKESKFGRLFLPANSPPAASPG
jgi:hypothetical protein